MHKILPIRLNIRPNNVAGNDLLSSPIAEYFNNTETLMIAFKRSLLLPRATPWMGFYCQRTIKAACDWLLR
jgi:hypothetical protein